MSAVAMSVLAAGSTGAAAVVALRARRSAAREDARLAGVAHELRGALQAVTLLAGSLRGAVDASRAAELTGLLAEIERLSGVVRDVTHSAGVGNGSVGHVAVQPMALFSRTHAADYAAPAPAPSGRRRAALAEAGRGAEGSRDTGRQGCDVAALVRELSAGWRLVAEMDAGRDIAVRCPAGGAWVTADRGRLSQALGNLVANALEHGRGRIEVVVTAANGNVRTEVRDEGAGLPASVAALTTPPADPAHSRGRGLGITAAIATTAGGHLAAAPTTSGARLVLDLPQAAAPVTVAL